MNIPEDQIAELKALSPEVSYTEEGGLKYLLLSVLKLPAGVSPSETEALLCASPRDGYQSRLFFPCKLSTKQERNWNAMNVQILGRSWCACSWQTQPGLRLAQMVAEHLRAFA